MVKQISLLLENVPGQLETVTGVLADGGIDIRALTVGETADFSVLRLIVDKHREAMRTLRNKGFVATESDILVVEAEDRPGALKEVASVLARAHINIDYVYMVTCHTPGKAMLAFRMAETGNAKAALELAGLKLVDDVVKAGPKR